MADNIQATFEEDFIDWDKNISTKWQEYWEKRGLHTPKPLEKKKKLYITAAYPYPNAPLHLGHGRTYLIPDVIARYYRMKGYNVLYPMAFHYTGTPILTMSESIAKEDPKVLKELVEIHGVPRDDIDKLKTPIGIASYFREWARKTMRDYMLSIDWSREFTTIDPEYKAFITWQFEKLREKGFVVQGTHPVGWCPVHESPVGMHDTKNDVEPEIQDFTLIFFRDENGIIFPAATLRPETVYGVTNMWINPHSEYVVAEVEGKKMVLSEKAAFKMKFQKDNVKILDRVEATELLGKRVFNPLTGKWVPILPSSFVDPDTGTGVVMSVPAHAPYDYAALKEIISDESYKKYHVTRNELEPIPLIIIKGYSDTPAAYIVEKMGVKSVNEREKLDKATKEIYLKEHAQGIMRKDIHLHIEADKLGNEEKELLEKLMGRPVKEVRKKLIAWMRSKGLADVFYEISNKPVYCRCGTEIVVKVLKNQWFIDYENPQWKETVKKAIETTTEIVPQEYKPWFYYTIDWLKKRACARTRGLGTPLPWDKDWIIESLSDSTLYMAFYTVIAQIRKRGIKSSQLKKEFWDYVFLGEGDSDRVSETTGISKEALEKIREEFEYWYPLDNRHSGKDLVPNHLTFMLFNHTAIFPQEKWPKRIVVNGHIMIEGRKMSKSLGNFIPLHKAIDTVGPNTLRLAMMLSAEIGKDSNYTRELVSATRSLLKRIATLFYRYPNYNEADRTSSDTEAAAEKWLKSKISRRIRETTDAIESYRLRAAALNAFTFIEQDISRYLTLGGKMSSTTLQKILDIWARLMAPFTPGFAEELWHILYPETEASVFEEPWPSPDDIGASPKDEAMVAYIESLQRDIESILEASKRKPTKIQVIVASKTKEKLLEKVISEVIKGKGSREIIRVSMKYLGKSKRAYESSKALYEFLVSLPKTVIKFMAENGFNEKEALAVYKPIIEKTVGVSIEVMDEEKAGEEVLSRRKPLPLKPALNFVF